MDINYIPHIPVRMVTRPCFVRGEKAIFHMFAEWISPELHEWMALIEYEDGRVRQVPAETVVFADGGEFKELSLEHAGRMYIQYRESTDKDNALVKMRAALDIIKELHSTEEGHTADVLFKAFCMMNDLETHTEASNDSAERGRDQNVRYSKWVDFNPSVTDLKCCMDCEYIVDAEEAEEFNYCPKCGAYMRGDETGGIIFG